MKKLSYIFLAVFLWIFLPMSASAQDQQTMSEADEEELAQELDSYVEQLTDLSNGIATAGSLRALRMLQNNLDILDNNWKIVSESMLGNIAESSYLMSISEKFHTLRNDVTQNMETQRAKILAVTDFQKARKGILDQIHLYDDMSKQAERLSLTSKTATQLELLKSKEQLVFQDLQQYYETAKKAAGINSKLKGEMENLEKHYVDLKVKSDAIQAAAYVPFLLRIKDYLLSFGGIAMILLFLNVLVTKLQGLKAAKEAAMKYKEMIDKNNPDIPTI